MNIRKKIVQICVQNLSLNLFYAYFAENSTKFINYYLLSNYVQWYIQIRAAMRGFLKKKMTIFLEKYWSFHKYLIYLLWIKYNYASATSNLRNTFGNNFLVCSWAVPAMSCQTFIHSLVFLVLATGKSIKAWLLKTFWQELLMQHWNFQ